MRFSERTAWEPGLNAWAAAAEQRRAAGGALLDLTNANPTACGLAPQGAQVLEALSAADALRYQPEPFGMPAAQRAVAAYYQEHGAAIAPERICLTTSTSEAYSFLFRLLCDPGDEVLIARPSYPLFDLLARVQDVALREYPLFEEPGSAAGGQPVWSLDPAALKAAITPRTRAIVVVHPNNPTGSYLSREDRLLLDALCAEHGLALLVDEVFLDYPVSRMPEGSFATGGRSLCFVLSGISKICALPQMKVSWLVATGPEAVVQEALRRLEIIADTYLSMNAPCQHALGSWLRARHQVQAAIRNRMRDNLALLDDLLPGSQANRLAMEGGWTAILRVPRFAEGKEFAMAALERGVLVQPGEFYGMAAGRCVLSLLTEPTVLQQGVRALPLW